MENAHPTNGTRFGFILILIGITVLLAFPRLVALGRFVTADEPYWGKKAANFYYAISHNDFAATYQVGHPGVTTMWIGSAAFLYQFPQYRRVGQTSLGDTKLLQIFKRHGPPPIQFLSSARQIQAVIIILALLLCFFYARSLFGLWPTLLGFAFIAFDPFHIAHSRIFHTNGLVSSLMFLALLSYISFLQNHRLHGLVVSSIATTFAILTVTQGLIILPAITVISLIDLWSNWRNLGTSKLNPTVKKNIFPFLFWIFLILLLFFLFWPAMWVAPLETVSKVFNHTFYATIGGFNFERSLTSSGSTMGEGSNPVLFYIKSYLWRSPLVIWIGCIGTLVFIILKQNRILARAQRKYLIYLFLYVIIYLLVMSTGDKKFDRYLLPIFLPLDLIAGIGWITATHWFNSRYLHSKQNFLRYGVFGLLVLVQLIFTLGHHPYYLTYYNPIMGKADEVIRDNMFTGWGEGLNEAAIYLQQKPAIQEKEIIAWYPLAFNWYSASLGFEANPIFLDIEINEDLLNDYLSADYAVIYINQWQRNYPQQLLEHLNAKSPEHTIQINDVDYVKIYNLND